MIALLALVAFGSNHTAPVESKRSAAAAVVDEGDQTPTSADTSGESPLVGIVLVVATVALLVAAVRSLTPRQLVRLIVFIVLIGVSLTALAGLMRTEEQPPIDASGAVEGPLGDHDAVPGRSNARPGILIAVAVVAVVAAAGLARRQRHGEPPPAPEAVSEMIATVLTEIDDIGDHREAVITAYARLEQALTRASFPRRPSETSREYIGRVLGAQVTDPEPVATLGELYERARFSRAPIDPGHRNDAVAALRSIQAETTPAGTA